LAETNDVRGIDRSHHLEQLLSVAIAIDTLAYARRLREAGFSERQAEGQAEALAATMTDTLATKQDLLELRTGIEGRFAGIDARFAAIDARFAAIDVRFEEMEKRFELRLNEQTAILRREMADMERRLTMRLGGMTVASVSIVSALARVL
jgi:hypothetical protein